MLLARGLIPTVNPEMFVGYSMIKMPKLCAIGIINVVLYAGKLMLKHILPKKF